MSLKEAGDILRQERERKGLSVDEVMQKTKISRRNLESLETGDPEGLPHEVYVRGFIKALAALYGIPTTDLRRMIDGHFGAGEDEEPAMQAPSDASAPPPRPVPVRPGKRRVWVVLLILFVILCGLVWGGVALFRSNAPLAKFLKPGVVKRDDAPKEAAPPDMAQGAAQSGAQGAAQTEPPVLGADRDGVSPPAQPSPAVSGDFAAQAPVALEAAQSSIPASEVPQPQVPPVEPPRKAAQTKPEAPKKESKPLEPKVEKKIAPAVDAVLQADSEVLQADGTAFRHALEISAKGECWVGAVIDGESKDFILREGRTVALRFNEALSVKFGNASAVSVRFDGKSYPFDTPPSQVLTLQFP